MAQIPVVKAVEILRQKIVLNHEDGERIAIYEIALWQVPVTKDYPTGVKYRAWVSEDGKTLFGLDNHRPKGRHLHVGDTEVGYVYRGLDALRKDEKTLLP